MNLHRAGRVVAVLAAVCGAGLGTAGAATAAAAQTAAAQTAAAQTVAWGTTSSAPAGARGELFGVAAASTADVLAVGGYNPGAPPTAVLTKPYAEHWDGAGWSAARVPLGPVYPAGEQAAQLNGVAEAGPSDGWAVGTVSDTSSLASRTLAYHWDGTAWTRSPTPNPAGPALGNQLDAIAARATDDVWAAGGDSFPAVSLLLHWNGSTWRRVSVPDAGTLNAVAVAPGHVWVAGGNQVEQSDGTTWAALPPLPVPAQSSLVIAGLADTGAGLWAVGTLESSCGEGGICPRSYAALWNGATWTAAPAGAGDDGLTGVVAAGSTVLATSGPGVLRLSLAGSTAQVTPVPGPAQLTAIAADPAGNPWAVGWTATRTKVTPAIINAPGIGQGGIIVTTGASGATVTWTGPAAGAASTDPGGRLAVGGLPDGSYTITAGLPGCPPRTVPATVTAGVATAVRARISCPA
ncbi:MAG TPA: hypothetical protein VGL63_01960 [Streptosporangiaceae bacterium]